MLHEHNKSLKSYLLVSNTALKKSYFAASVVLVMEHDALGAFGLILNRLNKKREVLHQIAGLTHHQRLQEIPLYEGGPVDPTSIFIVHSDPTIDSFGREILPEIFLGSSVDLFEELLEGTSSFNVYQGYAGWSAGQLEQEIQSKSWIVLPASGEIIFHSKPETAWKEALSIQGGLYAYFAEKVYDPLLN